jgi:hypothetical protein
LQLQAEPLYDAEGRIVGGVITLRPAPRKASGR